MHNKTIDGFAIGLAKTVIKYKYLVAILMIGLAMAIAYGGNKLGFDTNYRAYFSDENPELVAFEDFQATYTKNDNFFFVLEPKDKKVFTKKNLKAVKDLTKMAWTIPFANRVDSITNFQNTFAQNDDLVVEDLIYKVETLDSRQLEEKKNIAINEPLIKNQLITADASATAINVVLQLPGKSLYEVPTAAAKAREFKNLIEKTYPNINVSLTGFGMLNNAFGESAYMDSKTLVPIMYVVLIISGLIILRSVIGTLITLVIAYLSVGIGMGVGGYAGVLLTPVSTSVPIIILTLAIADSIHIFLSIKKQMLIGLSKNDAIIESMRINFMPVTITSITTIIGFAALNFSDSPPYWHLGNLSAAGIAAGWLLSLSLFPALMAILPYRKKASNEIPFSDRISEQLGKFVIGNTKTILVVGVLSSIALLSFIPSIQFNDQWSDYFDESIEFRRDTDQATRVFGLYPIEYSVPAKAAQGVNRIEYLKKLSEFTDFLRTQPNVSHVFSYTDILKKLNKNMHGDNENYYSLPETKDSASDYLFLYELSLPYGLDLNDRINIDKSATRVTVTLGKTSTIQTKDFLDSTKKWINLNFPEYMKSTKPTSAHVMFTYITDRNVESMISGYIVAILLIAIVLAIALRSISLGILSLIPNGLPIVLGFGVWALLVGTVGFSIAAVAAISFGIVVDDTVHFLSKYQLGRHEKNYSPEDAVIEAYKSVGPAMVSSTVILIFGFIVMASSTFKMNTDLGLLTAITIFIALIFDLFLLPVMLLLLERTKPVSFSSEVRDENVLKNTDNLKPVEQEG